MNAQKGQILYHINGNRLDNRRENLRIVDKAKNAQNRKVTMTKQVTNYKGISYNIKEKKYLVQFILNSETHYLGKIDAVEYWDRYIIQNKFDHILL